MGPSVVLALPVIPFLVLVASVQGVLATVTSSLVPGFHFGYSDNSGQHLEIPVTAQCERINLMWTRGTNDTGPSPIAPYFFQVYTSTSDTPYVVYAGFGPTFGWDVPFTPGTQYQICMFDTNGVSGGCRATYTVIANTTATTPTCQNVTAPSELSVSGTVPLGALSKYSYIDQCTSLSVKPLAGTPPFTLTVAPSSHPPYNLTSNTMDPISWQVSLPVGYHFFLGLSSSDGLLWGNGPMRVGGLGPTDCLAPGTISRKEALPIIIGTSLGGTALGLAIGVLAYILFTRAQRRRKRSPSQNYFASQYFSSTKPYRAPTVVPSTIASSPAVDTQRTYRASAVNPPASMPDPFQFTQNRTYSFSPSLPTMSDSTTPSFSTNISETIRELPRVPLEPLHSERRPESRLPFTEPSIIASSDTSSEQNHFPMDVKRRQLSSLADDTASMASSSTARLPPSSLSRSPTYARHPPSTGYPVYAIDETEVPDVPPEYGRHTDDTSCTPSIISSGRIPSERF